MTQVTKAVIAVPAKFDARQKRATGEAYRRAGLKVGCLCCWLVLLGGVYVHMTGHNPPPPPTTPNDTRTYVHT